MNRVLVTGATGFVGRHLCESLTLRGYRVTGIARSGQSVLNSCRYDLRTIGDISSTIDWGPFLQDVEFVVHLAARVHVMKDSESDPVAAFRRVNVHGTEQLLRHENMRNVKRFVYMSTVKVHGESTSGRPLIATDKLAPADPYAQSKLEAERLVEEIGGDVGIETAIIRPPLVYGPRVGGNFVRLMRMVDRGIPLPFARISNSRSLVGIENLCDLIHECLTNPSASGKKFLVSDNSDISTPGLVELIATKLNRPARLLPVPASMLDIAARLVRRSAEASRLTGSMQVDIMHTMESLSWAPPVSIAAGIQSTVSWYQEQKADV